MVFVRENRKILRLPQISDSLVLLVLRTSDNHRDHKFTADDFGVDFAVPMKVPVDEIGSSVDAIGSFNVVFLPL